jgi:hypothetical protein
MELANNAVEIYRQGVEFRSTQPVGYAISTKCYQLAQALSNCVLSKGLNPLNHQSTLPVKKAFVTNAMLTNGNPSAPEQSEDTNSNPSTANQSTDAYTPNSSWTPTCRPRTTSTTTASSTQDTDEKSNKHIQKLSELFLLSYHAHLLEIPLHPSTGWRKRKG